MINLNDMAKTIAEKEKGNRQVDITQIKEIMKIFLEELSRCSDEEVITLLNRMQK